MSSLTGRVALVTGAAQGIGFGIAARFAVEGASVVVVDREDDAVDQAAATLRESGGRAIGVSGDVRSADDVASWVSAAEAELGPVDILVNNAAVTRNKPFLEHDIDDWDVVLDTNLKGPFLCCQAVAPSMVARHRGAILNITSMAAIQYGGVPHVAYSSAKAGLVALTRDLAHELGPLGVRVNAIAPGPVMTPMSEHTLTAETKRAVEERAALRRWGQPSDIGAAALFLVSDESSFVTGVTLQVSGG